MFDWEKLYREWWLKFHVFGCKGVEVLYKFGCYGSRVQRINFKTFYSEQKIGNIKKNRTTFIRLHLQLWIISNTRNNPHGIRREIKCTAALNQKYSQLNGTDSTSTHYMRFSEQRKKYCSALKNLFFRVKNQHWSALMLSCLRMTEWLSLLYF